MSVDLSRLAPWEVHPDRAPFGLGPDDSLHMDDVAEWVAFWRSLSVQQRAAYVEAHRLPDRGVWAQDNLGAQWLSAISH